LSEFSAYAPWDGDPDHALGIAHLLKRVAGIAGVHIYELEVTADGGYRCRLWVGDTLERLVGPIPDGVDPEDAWEACVHPDDRALYDDSFVRQCRGEATDVEYRMQGFDGVVRWVWERCLTHTDSDGRLIVDGIATDITERRRIQEQLADAAYRDSLTGLPNRRWFEAKLDAELAGHDGTETTLAVLFVDLDGFKTINDAYGHAVGDELLVAIADRLRRVAIGSHVARLGGDEFLVLALAAAGTRGRKEVLGLADRIGCAVKEPHVIGAYSLSVRASVGVAVCPPSGATSVEMVRAADASMYAAKRPRRAA
jgi:diguanylate cyclase (GGDEF)-like protein/PAS domain S-box-containing protein